MPRNIRSTVITGSAIVTLAVSLAAPLAAAASAENQKVTRTHRIHHVYAAPSAGLIYARGTQASGYIPPNAIRTPRYVFVPGAGILDEACNLPTSACPNSDRDVQ